MYLNLLTAQGIGDGFISEVFSTLSDKTVHYLVMWSCIFLLCFMIEFATQGLTTIWFAGGAIIAGIVSLFGVNFPIQFLVFIVVSLILVFTTRPIALKYFNLDDMEKTNIESLVGKTTFVTDTIDNFHNTGGVTINDIDWMARSADNSVILKGDLVKILEIQGVKLIVTNRF